MALKSRGDIKFGEYQFPKRASLADVVEIMIEKKVVQHAFTVAEGAAGDWLSLGLIDGYDVAHWVGVSGYVAFVCAMTAGRIAGPALLDRYAEEIPVTLVDGRQHDFWRVDESRLRAALASSGPG